MDQFLYFCLIGIIAAFVAAGLIFARLKPKTHVKKLPEFCIGAIRVTDRQGRDMLIIRKEDGTFEMHEEQKIRNQCVQ
ncbi:MAG: hypothetical protein ABSF52_00765 [Syntrophobacteraceae bacterium]|jgi:hypothetical protein